MMRTLGFCCWIAIAATLAMSSCGCGDVDPGDDDTSATDDDDTTATSDDDSGAAGDDDDTTPGPSGNPSCDDLDYSALGQPLEFAVLVCDESMMGWEDASDDKIGGESPRGVSLASQQDLEAYFESIYLTEHLPCHVDFAEEQVLATYHWEVCYDCARIEICGVHDSGDRVTVSVIHYHLDDSVIADLSRGYHMVRIDRTDTPVEYVFHELSVDSQYW
jgi:hypothetical protein